MLYYAYIYSKIQYGIEVFGSASNTTLKKIQTKQNTALKILFNKDFYTSTNLLHAEMGVLLVKDIYNMYLTKFVYKHQHNLLPEAFDDYYSTNNLIHVHNTRQKANLHKTQYKTMYGEKMIKHKGSQLWNDLPLKVRNCNSIKTFSKYAKEYFIQRY